MPAYVGLPNTHSVGLAPGYHGAAYLGVGYNPFSADGDPEYRALPGSEPGLARRRRLRGGSTAAAVCSARSTRPGGDVDASGLMDGLDRFEQEAFSLVLGQAARAGFDLSQGRPAAPRPLLPPSVGPECTAGPPAGRGGRAVRHPDLRRLGLPFEPRKGHAPSLPDPRRHRRQL